MTSVKKPQDIRETAVHDMSDRLDTLALLLMTSKVDDNPPLEAYSLRYYGKYSIERSRPGNASNEGQILSPQGGSSICEDEIQVVNTTAQRQIIEPFYPSKGQVCALVPDQALDCGIGPAACGDQRAGGITYLSAKDVLRWRKLSEWLEGHVLQDDAMTSDHFRSQPASVYDMLKSTEVSVPACTLVPHVPDLSNFSFRALNFASDVKFFLTIISALPAVYGGIHLTAWNLHFTSKSEQLLWRIACFDIMGTIPAAWLYLELLRILIYRHGRRMDQQSVWDTLYLKCYGALFLPLFTMYMLARFYVVVEAFISLRHVPIGVYAAIPWVQAIPHV